jgi:2-polyprenyl-3-methyl-5-hydroxy-6-metoxy-1,4-benzoquinol methylase
MRDERGAGDGVPLARPGSSMRRAFDAWLGRVSAGSGAGLRRVTIAPVARTLDPEGAHLAALRRLARFDGRRVLEMGCGEGRLTQGIALEAAKVVAFDPDAASVAEAQASLPAELADRVAFQVASAEEIEIERGAFDLVVFSWSL